MKCADCECVPELCQTQTLSDCKFCIKDNCCCIEIHVKKSIKSTTIKFFGNVRTLYASALGIEILCILSAEIGQNTGFFMFGFKTPSAIVMSYALGYGLAGFTTFATILGRYNLERVVDGCCSVLEDNHGLVYSIEATFKNFVIGIKKIPELHKSPDFTQIIKTSFYVLITAESACILTAETVNLVFFRHALWLSIPLSLLAGAFAITIIESYKKTRQLH